MNTTTSEIQPIVDTIIPNESTDQQALFVINLDKQQDSFFAWNNFRSAENLRALSTLTGETLSLVGLSLSGNLPVPAMCLNSAGVVISSVSELIQKKAYLDECIIIQQKNLELEERILFPTMNLDSSFT